MNDAPPPPQPCPQNDPTVPSGQASWSWSQAIGQWNLVGCNCTGDCIAPPDFIGAYDGQVQNTACFPCLSVQAEESS
jgi:hypothetical protein